MRRVCLEYATRAELGAELARAEDRELLPQPRGSLRDREWVLVVVKAGTARTAVAAQVIDRETSQGVRFEPRDWRTLEYFAHAGHDGCVGASAPSALSVHQGDHRVLVVADPDLQPVLRAMVQACGFEALAAASAEEAFDQLRENRIGLVVVDQHLPGMSACEFCRRLGREQRSRRPVLVLAAQQFAAGGDEPSCAAADDYVLAPLRTSELGARMLGLLTRRQTQHPESI